MSENSCCNTGKNIIILACSGAANVGQLSNQAAVELAGEGLGSYFCLAGIGSGQSGFVRSAIDADEMVVLDGCPIGCAKRILERNNVPLRNHLVVTSLGIDKTKKFALDQKDIRKVKDAVRVMLQEQARVASNDAEDAYRCCETIPDSVKEHS